MHFLKQIFIPHEHNSYRPHLIRRHGLAFALLLVIATQIVNTLQIDARPKVLGYATNISVSGLLSNTNSKRASNGKSALSISSKLNTAAQAKANDMITDNYWAHTAPDGTTPWDWFDYAGYDYLVAGENLAYGFDTSSGVVTGWMNSPSHRDNMLNSSFQDVGFGIANGSNYQGGPNTVVVAMYGDPAVLAETSPPTSNSSQPTAAAPKSTSSAQPVVAAAEPAKPASKASEEPLEEPTDEPVETEAAPTNDNQLVSNEAKHISNLQALLSGQAGWALYLVSLVALAIGFVYLYRHILFIHNAVIKGEKYIVSHPMLEASIVYALIWLLLSGSFGNIL